ncbi:beta-N-acetylhexosaminidase [Paenibacillus melissococcoides]|uniref:Beta-N-acetylhexosaminidase n=1 Tax=Paenibacillus melissococcoides TaxID=2912268 RepID=A0ABM9G1I7_9BACL|nr:beta-N-acetylhexosaminidase [Paenibacillus melissococcoides]CAH8245463.1 beta-N-acetylhexosaminidase [Paenibacillus melissococcoides]CAH8711018.1 beta-N-acetylhexosaminidase [Paenibacillus melissococcoides]CAH8711796.1 beta-N-acetylhexosaminidase [Paenibacillus melissococcoides]
MGKQQLTLEQKIGQMVMCGFHGPVVNDNIRTLIEKHHVGGIIYFRRNVQSKEQVCGLSRELQLISRKHTDIPLFICIDQEGGMVARIDWDDITLIPGNMAIGAARSAEDAYEAARICGEELLHMGINMNFAPSVDVNNNALNPVIGVRSYGERPDLVAELGAAQIRGLQEANVAATAKHFPGHGDTAVDSHHGLAAVNHDEERLLAIELAPFIRAIREGVDLIMTAHVMFPAFEPNPIPATLSRNVLTNLLRKRIGYNGVIVTDCLEMHAISKEFGIPEGAVRSVEAGADLVLVSHTYEEQVAAIAALVEAVRSGRIPESQIDESVDRLLSLKAKRSMDALPEVTPRFAALFGSDASKAVVDRICENSITLVKNEGGSIPLRKEEPTLVIWPEVRQRTEVDEPIEQSYTLATALSPYVDHVEKWRIGTYPEADEVKATLEKAASFKQIVVLTYNAVSTLHPGQVEIVQGLIGRPDAQVIVASTRNPYDLNQFPDAQVYLCCYENRPATMKALAAVLAGKQEARGKLPVTISPEYPFGHQA